MIPLQDLLRQLKGENDHCACQICKRIRKINRICKSLKPSDADWLIEFHDYVLDLEHDKEMHEETNENSKN